MTLTILEELSNNLLSNKCFNTENYESIIFKLEQISRKETNISFSNVLSNNALASKLVEIGKKNKSNVLLISRILSLLGNMFRRYGLHISNEIWNFYIDFIKIKGAQYYVYLFLPIFPQFKDYDGKWEIIIEMPNIAPKKSSIINYYALIKSYINGGISIPKEYQEKIIAEFHNLLNSNKIGENTKKNFMNLLSKLEQQ